MLCFTSCNEQTRVKAFLAKYEFEDFSQFNNVSVFIRGVDSENNPIVMIDAPHWIYDTSRVGLYVVILDKKSNQIIKTKWTLTENIVDADSVKLQQLIQTFIKYRIPRLNVDTAGNVFVYLKDCETLTLARFVGDNEFTKYNIEAWKKIKNNWYIMLP